MKTAVVIMYFGMLLFDLAVLAGTAWLVAQRGWSPWWFAFAFVVCVGSSPGRYIELTAGAT